MRVFKIFAAMALGLGLMGVSAQAATLDASAQTNSLGDVIVDDAFAGGVDASFELPTDFEINISDKYANADGDHAGTINRLFRFDNTVATTVFQFSTFNQLSEFTDLTFTWTGAGLGAGLVITPLSTPSQTFISMLAGGIYELAVTGVVNLPGTGQKGQYDISLVAAPIPAAAWLFGTALLGGGIVAGRRRRRTAAVAA